LRIFSEKIILQSHVAQKSYRYGEAPEYQDIPFIRTVKHTKPLPREDLSDAFKI